MEKKHKIPPGRFCPRVTTIHAIDSYSARSKYYLTIKKPLCTHFYGAFDFGKMELHDILTSKLAEIKAISPVIL